MLDYPCLLYLGVPVTHAFLVTPAGQGGLNPNANVFESKLPGTDPASPWEDGDSLALTTTIADSYQYMNGDINKLTSGITAFTSVSASEVDSSLAVSMPADFSVLNGWGLTVPAVTTDGIAFPPPPTSSVPNLAPLVAEDAPASHGPPSSMEGADTVSSVAEDEHQTIDGVIPPDQLKNMLQQQLEYYFSRENLANDKYLLSQMDGDQYVSIGTVANFNQIRKLTKDINLIVQVLRDSPNVQVDEAGEKVRPNHKRCIVILREIPDSTPIEEVEALFRGETCPKFVSCEFAHNSNWYVTFESDEDAQRAYRYLREETKTFQSRPILARIKAKPMVRNSFAVPKNGYPAAATGEQPQPAPFHQQGGGRYPAYMPSSVPSTAYNHQQPTQQQQQQQVHLYQAFPPYFQPHNMIQTWATPGQPYLDIGSVFTMNGLAPQVAFKPTNGNSRHSFISGKNSFRNPKPHLRNQISTERPNDLRPNYSSLLGTPNGGQSRSYPDPAEIPGKQQPEFVRPPSPASSDHHAPSTTPSTSSNASTAETQTLASALQNSQTPRHRRRKKDEDPNTAKSRSDVCKSASLKDCKSPSPKFDLEAASFPPLPGSEDVSASESEIFESRLSDVVKGTSKPTTKEIKTQAAAITAPPPPATVKEAVSAAILTTASVLTNGECSVATAVTPPRSPARISKATSTADITARTDSCPRQDEEISTPTKPASHSATVAAQTSPPKCNPLTNSVGTMTTPVVASTSSKTLPAAGVSVETCPPAINHHRAPPAHTSASPSRRAAPSPAVANHSVSPVSVAAFAENQEHSKLSYAQMALRGKDSVEKIAREQREKQEAQERERRQREREEQGAASSSAVPLRKPPAAPVAEKRFLRDRNVTNTGGSRGGGGGRYPPAGDRERFARPRSLGRGAFKENDFRNGGSREPRFPRDRMPHTAPQSPPPTTPESPQPTN